MKKNTTILQTTAALIAAAIVSGCALQNDEVETSSQSSQNDGIVITTPSGGSSTVAVASFDNVFANMKSVTGVSVPSATSTNLYNQNKTSYSASGSTSEINAGMWMSVSALGGSMCQDLYVKEQPAAAAKFFFQGLNLTTGSNNFGAQEDAILNRLALSFWGRPATSTEVTLVKTALTTAVGANRAALSQADTHDAILVMCTGALASLSAIEI